jgi:hypothetical protein
MIMERINPFAEPAEAPVFTPKPKATKPAEIDTVDQIAREQNFPSRQAPRASAPARKRRTYTTGRNQQINFKATAATIERFYRIADEKRLPLCETLEVALDALERDSTVRP